MSTSRAVHEVFGLRVGIDRALPIPTADADGAVDVTVLLDRGAPSRSAVVHVRTDADHEADGDDPWVIEEWLADGALRVTFTEWDLSFEITPEAVRRLGADEGLTIEPDADLVVHALLDHVLPRVVAMRGDLALHAAGVVGPRGAVILLGGSGTGKTTLSVSLALAGWPLLDDDGIRILVQDGIRIAMPGYPSVRLRSDSVAVMSSGLRVGRPMAADPEKRWVTLRDDGGGTAEGGGAATWFADGAALVASVYVLQRCDTGGAVERDRLGLSSAFDEIAAHAIVVDRDHRRMVRRMFEDVGGLAATAPVYRLRVPADLARLGEVGRSLREWERPS